MKTLPKVVLLLVLLSGISALAVGRSMTCKTTLTGSGPLGDPNTTTPPCTISLRSASGYRITAYASDGGTLTGAGTVQAYYCPQPNSATLCSWLWPRDPALDDTVTVTPTSCLTSDGGGTSGCSAQQFPDHPSNTFGDGWLGVAASGFAVTLGSGAAASSAYPLYIQVDVQGNQ